MSKAYSIGNKAYRFGKTKSTGLYTVWEWKESSGFQIIFQCVKFEELKKYIGHLKYLAAKRESRQAIADICGTSYRAAMADMGR